MYYSNGNYEAFARPLKPEGVDDKSAYIIGSGLAGLASASFLIRDGQMKGENIHIIEELDIAGGSLDGLQENQGWVIRGGREMENHFECLWDLFRSIPSLEIDDASVLDEFYWLNKRDPNYSKMRATQNRGQDGETNGKFTLSDKATREIVELFLATEDSLANKKITDVFSEEFFASNFWLYWRTMFAFEEWHSAAEMRRYIMRFIHHLGGLPDLSALKFTKYNQYESLVLPLISFLEAHNVNFIFNADVYDIFFDVKNNQKIAHTILYQQAGTEKTINLTDDDLLFITNGSITESSTLGDHKTSAKMDPNLGGSWKLWEKIASKNTEFGKPAKFNGDVEKTKFLSATLTTIDDKIPPYIEKITQRDPFAGKVVTGGIVSAKDSSWLMSWTINRQPHFKNQKANEITIWIYGLFGNNKGDYINKPMVDCTGKEIAQEWLYHIGVPESEIDEMAATSTNCIPCMMPYAMSYFMPREKGDRPLVVPQDSLNFAFIGNFSETERDTVFTTEYSVRTAMEAVYTLLKVDRGVPEVFASCFDIRELLDATYKVLDKKKITDIKLPFLLQWIERKGLQETKGTFVEEMLKKYNLI